VPVCFVSARSGVGISELLGVFEKLLPHPGEANPPPFVKGRGSEAAQITATPDPKAHVIADVFKIVNDPFVGKLGVFRVYQGTVRKDTQLFIDGHITRVHPCRAGCFRRRELCVQLARGPQIVVIKEGDPLSMRGRDAGVPSSAHSARTAVSNEPHSMVLRPVDQFGGRWFIAVIDHQNFSLDAFLPENRPKRERKQIRAISCGDHDAHVHENVRCL